MGRRDRRERNRRERKAEGRGKDNEERVAWPCREKAEAGRKPRGGCALSRAARLGRAPCRRFRRVEAGTMWMDSSILYISFRRFCGAPPAHVQVLPGNVLSACPLRTRSAWALLAPFCQRNSRGGAWHRPRACRLFMSTTRSLARRHVVSYATAYMKTTCTSAVRLRQSAYAAAADSSRLACAPAHTHRRPLPDTAAPAPLPSLN